MKSNNDKSDKKSGSIGLWIAVSACFLILIAAAALWLSSPKTPENSIETRTQTFLDAGFDTPVVFSATGSLEDFEKWSGIVENTFKEENEIFDQYNDYPDVNNVKTINETGVNNPLEVDETLIECLKDSFETAKVNSKFDISEGKLLNLWHDIRESDSPALPDQQQIDQAKDHTGMEGIIIDGNTVSLSDESVQIDLGAIAKGYTAQICADRLIEAGCNSGFINAGGNVVLIGNKENGKDWVIGIQDPDGADSIVQVTLDKPMALVTSGDYQRYVEIDGKRYGHIIDPDTGWPAEYMRSVTVIDEDSARADGLSTALFCMSVEEGMEKAKELGIEAIWITDSGTLDLTPDLESNGLDIYVSEGLKDNVRLSQNK